MWIHEPKLISTLGGGQLMKPKEKSTLKSEWDKIVNKTDNKLFDVMANLFNWQFNKNGYSIPEMRKYKR